MSAAFSSNVSARNFLRMHIGYDEQFVYGAGGRPIYFPIVVNFAVSSTISLDQFLQRRQREFLRR
jgi:hypothetical protein